VEEALEEMEFHRAMLAANGATPGAMGNTTLAREHARAAWVWPWLESLGRPRRMACARCAASLPSVATCSFRPPDQKEPDDAEAAEVNLSAPRCLSGTVA
jgi:hypothetical protein